MNTTINKRIIIGATLSIVGTLLFSLKSIFIKTIYNYGLDANSVLALRMIVSLPIYLIIMLVLLRFKKQNPSLIKSNLTKIIILGFIGYFLASWFDLKGLEYISASLERLTLFTYPIWTVILGGIFFNNKITKKIILSLILSYLGVLIAFAQEIDVNQDVVYGTTMVLISAFSFAFYVLFGKSIITQIGSMWFTAIAMSFSSVFVIIYYFIFFDIESLKVNNEVWFWIFMLSIFSTVLPSFLISSALKIITATQNSIIGMLGPIMTILLAVLILDEVFNFKHIIALALIISGVYLVTKEYKK